MTSTQVRTNSYILYNWQHWHTNENTTTNLLMVTLSFSPSMMLFGVRSLWTMCFSLWMYRSPSTIWSKTKKQSERKRIGIILDGPTERIIARNERTNEWTRDSNVELSILRKTKARKKKENNKTSRLGLTYLYKDMPYSLFGKSCSLFLKRIEMLSKRSSLD